jgi:hypothetical protein
MTHTAIAIAAYGLLNLVIRSLHLLAQNRGR